MLDAMDLWIAQGAYNEQIRDDAKAAQLEYEAWLDSVKWNDDGEDF